jgi:putative ATPase
MHIEGGYLMSDQHQILYGSSDSAHFTLIQVIQADITNETTDAIVNAANNELMHGGGVAGAISSRGGREIQRQSDLWVDTYGSVPTGGVAVTGPGRLPTRFVIHAVGPVYRSKARSEPELREAIWNSLAKADELGLQSISLPAISSGIFGYPKEDCAEVFFEVVPQYIREHKTTNLHVVRLSNFDYPTTAIFRDEFNVQFGMVEVKLGLGADGEVDFELSIAVVQPRPVPVKKTWSWY